MKAKFINEYLDDIESWERKTERDVEPEKYNQLCVWPATSMGDGTPEEFEDFMYNEFGVRTKFDEEVTTLPGQGGEGGRHNLFFYVHDDDVANLPTFTGRNQIVNQT